MPEYKEGITLKQKVQGYLLHQSLIRFKHTMFLTHTKLSIKIKNVKNSNPQNSWFIQRR